jgi:hypothetical protein
MAQNFQLPWRKNFNYHGAKISTTMAQNFQLLWRKIFNLAASKICAVFPLSLSIFLYMNQQNDINHPFTKVQIHPP